MNTHHLYIIIHNYIHACTQQSDKVKESRKTLKLSVYTVYIICCISLAYYKYM